MKFREADRSIIWPFTILDFDVAIDGASLLVLRPTEVRRVFIVANWAEEVRARIRQNRER